MIEKKDGDIDKLQKENARLQKENGELRKKLRDIERALKRMGLSLPQLAASEGTAEAGGIPSSKVFYKRNRNPGHAPTGGKPGHKGHARHTPEPTGPPIVLELAGCPDCGHELGEPCDELESTITDIPPPQLDVYQLIRPRYRCPGCKKRVQQPNPFAYKRFGVNLSAWVAHQYMLGLTLGKIHDNAKETFELHLSDGAILGMLEWVSSMLEDEYEAIEKRIKKAKTAGADETGFRIGGQNGWMWVVEAIDAVLYRIANTRGQSVPQEMLEGFDGVLGHDGWRAYRTVAGIQHQLDYVHINRWLERAELKNRIEPRPLLEPRQPQLKGPGRPPKELLRFIDGVRDILRDAVSWIETYPNGSKRSRKKKHDWLYAGMVKHLERPWRHEDAVRICETLMVHSDSWFNCVLRPEVPWNNNGAERAVRKGVLHRKIRGGLRTWDGARRLEVMLSASETARRTGKNFLGLVRSVLDPDGLSNSRITGD